MNLYSIVYLIIKFTIVKNVYIADFIWLTWLFAL